jgi:hypothetical protein
MTLYGSATKVVKVLEISITATATTIGTMVLSVIKRSAVDTGGTSAAATAISYDANDAAATATALTYTVNPAGLGTAIGSVHTEKVAFTLVGGYTRYLINFCDTPSKAPTLRGTSSGLAINFNGGAVPAGGNLALSIRWTEE